MDFAAATKAAEKTLPALTHTLTHTLTTTLTLTSPSPNNTSWLPQRQCSLVQAHANIHPDKNIESAAPTTAKNATPNPHSRQPSPSHSPLFCSNPPFLFQARALESHPDKNVESTAATKTAEEKFKLLGEALEVLSDDMQRKLWNEGYDKEAIAERVRAAERAASHHTKDGCCGGGCH